MLLLETQGKPPAGSGGALCSQLEKEEGMCGREGRGRGWGKGYIDPEKAEKMDLREIFI